MVLGPGPVVFAAAEVEQTDGRYDLTLLQGQQAGGGEGGAGKQGEHIPVQVLW